MAKLRDKVFFAFNEDNILRLGTQLFLSVGFRDMLTKDFAQLPPLIRYLRVGETCLMLISLIILVAPAVYHHIVDQGEASEHTYRFTAKMLHISMLPFVAAVSIAFSAATQPVFGAAWAVVAGVVMAIVGLAMLYSWKWIGASNRREILEQQEKRMAEDKETAVSPGGSELKDRIMYSLMENQMILPGVQLLIGFQIGSMITKDFMQLPFASRITSLASLALLLVTMLLLMMPAAYHRYVERGESTVKFERFSERVLKWSMLPFALGLCGNFYVVLQKVFESVLWACVGSLITLAVTLALWYVYPVVRGRIVNAQRESRQM